jgi:hypothetical protein
VTAARTGKPVWFLPLVATLFLALLVAVGAAIVHFTGDRVPDESQQPAPAGAGPAAEETYLNLARKDNALVADRSTMLEFGRTVCTTSADVAEPCAAHQIAIGHLVSYGHLRWPVAKAIVNAALVSGLCANPGT